MADPSQGAAPPPVLTRGLPRRGGEADPVAFWPRVLSPLLVLLGAMVIAIVAGGISAAAGLSDDEAGSVVLAAASLGILLLGILVVQGMRPLDRRLIFVRKGGFASSVLRGVGAGALALVAAGIVLSVGSWIDPGAGDKLEDVGRNLQDSGTAPWQSVLLVVSLVVLAPLGEELLFRGVLLRTLVRRLAFWPAAVLGSALFALAHLDQYDPYPIWPRTLSLAVIGLILARTYRNRGYVGSVAAHATVNAVAAIALLAS